MNEWMTANLKRAFWKQNINLSNFPDVVLYMYSVYDNAYVVTTPRLGLFNTLHSFHAHILIFDITKQKQFSTVIIFKKLLDWLSC